VDQHASSQKHVVVYSSPTRGPCKAAKEFLSSQNVPYEDINVIGDPQALEHLIKLTGRTSIPVIMVDDQVVQGFDKPKLKSLLGL